MKLGARTNQAELQNSQRCSTATQSVTLTKAGVRHLIRSSLSDFSPLFLLDENNVACAAHSSGTSAGYFNSWNLTKKACSRLCLQKGSALSVLPPHSALGKEFVWSVRLSLNLQPPVTRCFFWSWRFELDSLASDE